MHRLDPLLRPRSIAVVGASERRGTVGDETVRNLLRGSYVGPLYAVNPRYETVHDVHCYPSLADLPEVPQHVVFAVSDERVEALIEDVIRLGVEAVTMMSALVLDHEVRNRAASGPVLKERVAARLRDNGVLACGANGMGFFNFRDGVWASGFETREHRLPGNVALLSQSGSGMCGIVDCDERIDFNFAVSSGQELTVTLADYLDFVLELPETRVVGLFIETIRDPVAFRAALEKAARRKVPLVAVKTGRTRAAAELALSHCGVLAGDDAAYDALFDRYGVQRVRDMDELATAMILFAQCGIPGPGGLVTLHDSGGERQLLVDLADAHGVALTTLSPSSVQALEALIDPELPAVNPLDGWSRGGAGAEETMRRALAILAADPGAAFAGLIHDRAPGGRIYEGYIGYLRHAREHSDTPLALVAARQGTAGDPRVVEVTRDLHMPVLDGVSTFLAGVRCLFGYRDFLARQPIPAPRPGRSPWQGWRGGAGDRNDSAELAGLRLLAAAGIGVPELALTSSADACVARWREFGAPVVLKTAADGLAHKSDAGGVILGLNDEMSIRSGWADLHARFGAAVIVATMAPGGVEMYLGMNRDRDLGPVVVMGIGGIHAELHGDVVSALPPFDSATAVRLLARLRLRPLLDGVRGAPPRDVMAFAEAAACFSRLAAEAPDAILAIDVNPVIVHTSGCTAVDVFIDNRPGAVAPARRTA